MDARNLETLMKQALREVEKISLEKDASLWVVGSGCLEALQELKEYDQEKKQVYGIDYLVDTNTHNRVDLYAKMCGIQSYYIEEFMTERGNVEYRVRWL